MQENLDLVKIQKAIQETIQKTIKEELNNLGIDKRMHYEHHKFIEDWLKWLDRFKDNVMSVFVKTIMAFIIGLLVLGFIFWGRKNL